jgi:hypothetical protein
VRHARLLAAARRALNARRLRAGLAPGQADEAADGLALHALRTRHPLPLCPSRTCPLWNAAAPHLERLDTGFYLNKCTASGFLGPQGDPQVARRVVKT